MNLVRANATSFVLYFDTTALYEDLLAVYRNAQAATSEGNDAQRYNGWLALDLDTKPKLSATERAAVAEIAAL
jgi:hypothetical protein